MRPERVGVTKDSPTPSSGLNVLRGRVRDLAYLGNQSRLTVELAGGKLVTAVSLNPGDEAKALEPGAEVALFFAPRDCRGLVK